MKIARTGLAVLAALLAAGAVQAKPVTLTCAFQSSSGLVAPEVMVRFDEATGAVSVSDDITRRYLGRAAEGRLHDTAARRTFRWAVEMSNSSGQRTRMDYSLTVFKDGRSDALLRAKPFGYANDFGGKGRCKASAK